MSEQTHKTSQSRRAFLRGVAATSAGALVAGSASANAKPDKLITAIQPWAQELEMGLMQHPTVFRLSTKPM